MRSDEVTGRARKARVTKESETGEGKGHPILLANGGMRCPRSSCRYETPYLFDPLAMAKTPECKEYLLPVWKCPQCRHLFALVPQEWLPVLRERGLIG